MVEKKGTTSYQEVADDLVREHTAGITLVKGGGRSAAAAELASPAPPASGADHKNIRRRAYDALNVLMAMGVIAKSDTKKKITWQGLPLADSSKPCDEKRQRDISEMEKLKRERVRLAEENAQKKAYLQQLLQQRVCYHNLVRHNKSEETSKSGKRTRTDGGETDDASKRQKGEEGAVNTSNSKLALPFIVINTSNQTQVGCRLSPERTQAKFTFQNPFEINDDNEMLKMLGL